MLDWKRAAMAAFMMIGPWGVQAGAQPALTTIQDILYLANGTRFNGTLYITYNSFQTGDAQNIATANLTVPIVNGVLNVQLVPTTTGSAGAQYEVTFNSGGIDEFSEIWAVPPSTVPLRLRDVLVSAGSVVGPAPVTTQIQISDVANLTTELGIRAMEGVGFALGRTAVIDSAGQIDGAAGNLSDCVHVDGSSGVCGGGSGGLTANYSDSEIPSGALDGVNTTFSLLFTPSPAASVSLYKNGLFMRQGSDYTLTGNQLTFFVASTPQPGDLLVASYRYANATNPLGSLTQPQVVCSEAGTNTSATAMTSLGTCTLPAGLLETGDRVEVQYQFQHSGTTTGFTAEVDLGGTVVVVSRAAAAAETLVVGHTAFGIYGTGQVWDTQSWGASLSFAVGAGTSALDPTQALTVAFRGLMAAAGSDSVALQNLTVVRYPAQTNP